MPSDELPWTEHPQQRDESADLGLLAPSWAGSAVAGLTGDAGYLRALLDAEAALTRAQAALGLAPRSAAAAVTAAAAEPHRHDARTLALRARTAGNPVVPLVADLTAAVADRDPGAAAYVHRGATSQDILDTATMLVCARALDTVLPDLARTAAALRRTAAEHRDTPMAGRTLTQHAVPTTFGLKAAGWRSLVLDAHDRLASVRAALPVQLGGAAGTLAAFHAYAEAEDGRPPLPTWGAGSSPATPPRPDSPHRPCPGTPCAPRSPISPVRWPSPRAPSASWPPMSSPSPARSSASSPRAAAAAPPPCRTRPTRCAPR